MSGSFAWAAFRVDSEPRVASDGSSRRVRVGFRMTATPLAEPSNTSTFEVSLLLERDLNSQEWRVTQEDGLNPFR